MRGLPADWLHEHLGSMKLGEILVDHGVINKSQLACLLGMQQDNRQRLGEIVLELELVTPIQLQAALEEQHRMEIT